MSDLTPMTAARLIELLARHIAEHGNTPVMIAERVPPHWVIPRRAVRCWYDTDCEFTVISSE